MQRLYPTFAQTPNYDVLKQELNTALSINSADCGYDGHYFVEVPENITSQQVQTIVNAHNPATLTTEQQKAVARTLMLADAKSYLSNQLAQTQWNNARLTEVYNTVKNFVDNNTILSQMVANQITLCSNSLTWVLNLVTPTAIDRQRYLFCVQLVISTIA